MGAQKEKLSDIIAELKKNPAAIDEEGVKILIKRLDAALARAMKTYRMKVYRSDKKEADL